MSTVSDTLAWLRAEGYIADVAERWIPKARVRKDLFGFCDVVAVNDEPGTLYLQVTTGAHHAARRKKMLDPPQRDYIEKILRAGNRVAIFSWSLRGKKGERKRKTPRIEYLTLSILLDACAE